MTEKKKKKKKKKKALTLPGHRYFSPGNPFDNGPPTDELDAICMKHDYCYSSNIPKSECDKNMLGKLSSSESKTFGVKKKKKKKKKIAGKKSLLINYIK